MKNNILNHFRGNFKAYYQKYLQKMKHIGGQEYAALCPFQGHNDKNPSFNFSNQTGHYYCHGCGKKGDVFHFYGKINGLLTGRDFGKILRGIANDFGIPWEDTRPKLVKTYDYKDENRKLLFQVCRYEPKDFRQRAPNGKGGWNYKLNGVRRVLYRLPEILSTQEILIVEGEKDSDTLRALNFAATTCPGGAKKWKPEYNDPLKGKDVILIPDNDNSGREHMAQIAASLKGVASSLKWIDLPNVPSKGDVTDFVNSFKDPDAAAERLALMIEQTGPYEPPKKTALEDIILSANQFSSIDLPHKREYLSPWIKECSIALISGWRGTGKTWFALSILSAISNGKPFGPWECKNSVPCLFLDGEMPPQDIAERMKALKLDSEGQNPLYVYSDAYANQCGIPRAHLGNETWRTKMKSILVTKKVKLWVIDNLASLAGGLDENSKKDWDPINSWLLELRFAGISSIMLHHVNKDGGQRGTSAREDNLDVSVTLKLPHDYTPEEGARFIAHFTKARVSTRDLPLIGDNEFKLVQNESADRYEWVWGDVKKERKKEILKMLDEGMDYETIKNELNLSSKGYITKVKKQAIEDGWMTPQGKLNPTGFSHLQ